MQFAFLILLVVMTSFLAYVLIRPARPAAHESLFETIGALLDLAGLFTLFMGANLVLGILLLLSVRGFSHRFISMYQLENVLLLILSAGQAIVFYRWWKRS